MTVRPAARRVPAFACVLLAHALAISALFILLRRQELPRTSESLLWLALPGAVTRPSTARVAPADLTRAPVVPRARQEFAPHSAEGAVSPAPDWSALAAMAAEREAGAIEVDRRQSRALAPPANALTGPRVPHALPFHWDRAHTQGVEPLATGGTLVHLSERCALVLYFVIPMAGCVLGEIPARGDLFDHMRDPPALGDRKD
jgi:hypothetical protein